MRLHDLQAMRLISLASLLALPPLIMGADAPPPTSAPVEVTVEGIGPPRGEIIGAICTEGEFSTLKCGQAARTRASDGSRATLRFAVSAGRYAVFLFHDINGDLRLHRSFLGIPLEGVGFSRDPRLRGKPTFAQTAFIVPPNGTHIAINLQFEPRG